MGKLPKAEVAALEYATRNHGRHFVTALEGEPVNVVVHRLTALGMFTPGGSSTFGEWRVITEAGRQALASPVSDTRDEGGKA